MTLSDYLAKNYLSAESTSKKRKRKHKSEGLMFAEDGTDDWTKTTEVEDEQDDAPTIAGTVLTGGLNRPKKNTTWTIVGSKAPEDADQIAADAILAQAQAESRAKALEDDNAPALVGDDGEKYNGATMANGALAGLQTADQVAAALERRKKAERRAMKDAGQDSSGLAQETIYRDATGRVINVAMKRAQLRQQAEEEERREREAAENAKGDVQKREKEARRAALQEAKTMTVARYADDKQMNDELRDRQRWNDPMAQLVGTKQASEKKSDRRSMRATYQGAFEPNRYGIKPSWRWDGVDRSNGFERKWFAARNKAKDRRELEYAWQMDE